MSTNKNVINMSNSCKYCNSNILSSGIKFQNNKFCNLICLNKYIILNNECHIICPNCNITFSKKKIGSYQSDIYNNIFVFCSHKCQFTYKS